MYGDKSIEGWLFINWLTVCELERSTMFYGKTHYFYFLWPFSIAMLNYQRVILLDASDSTKWAKSANWPVEWLGLLKETHVTATANHSYPSEGSVELGQSMAAIGESGHCQNANRKSGEPFFYAWLQTWLLKDSWSIPVHPCPTNPTSRIWNLE